MWSELSNGLKQVSTQRSKLLLFGEKKSRQMEVEKNWAYLEIQSTGGGGGNFQLHVALVDAPDYKVEKTIPISWNSPFTPEQS